MSPSERKNFTRYVNLVSSKKPLYVVLYDRLLEKDNLDLQFIRGKEFAKSSTFATYRKILIERIVQSKVYFSDLSFSVRLYISEAAKLDAMDLVDEKFRSEFEEGLKREDFHYLLYLHSLRRYVKEHFLYQIPFDKNWPGSSELLEKVGKLERFQRLLESIRVRLMGEKAENPFETQRIIKEFEAIESENGLGSDQLSKLRVGTSLVKGNFVAVFQHQKRLVERLLEDENEEIAGRTIREISYLIKLGIVVEEKDLVVKYTLLLSGLNFRTPLFEEIQTKFWIMDAISVADAYTDFKIAKSAFSSIREIDDQFSDKQKGILLYSIAKTSFLSGNPSFSQIVLTYKFGNQKRGQAKHHLFAKLVELLVLLEGDDFDEIDRSINRFKRLNQKVASSYLDRILVTLEKYTKVPINELNSILKSALLDLESNPPQESETMYFDFTVWLKSKLFSHPYKSVIEKDFAEGSSVLAIGF